MTDNTILSVAVGVDDECIERAKNRVLRAYSRFGNWRKVGQYFGVHHTYAWKLGLHGVVPPNPDTRRKLGLPRVLPSERKPKKKKRDTPKVWEDVDKYLRKVKP